MRRTKPIAAMPDPRILVRLETVVDRELGLSIIALGLAYGARQDQDGIVVDMTLTSRSCPMGELILGEAREALALHFPHASHIVVRLVWEPPWTPDMVGDGARAIFGMSAR